VGPTVDDKVERSTALRTGLHQVHPFLWRLAATVRRLADGWLLLLIEPGVGSKLRSAGVLPYLFIRQTLACFLYESGLGILPSSTTAWYSILARMSTPASNMSLS
jgi:hypothetical protein